MPRQEIHRCESETPGNRTELDTTATVPAVSRIDSDPFVNEGSSSNVSRLYHTYQVGLNRAKQFIDS